MQKTLRLMATVKLYLDTRGIDPDHDAPLKVSINHKKQASYINTSVRIKKSQWDPKTQKIIQHPQKAYLNTYISKLVVDIQIYLIQIKDSTEIHGLSAYDIKKKYVLQKNPEENKPVLFISHFIEFYERKTNTRTKEIYISTLNSIKRYCSNYEQLKFEDVNNAWLNGYNSFLSINAKSVNSRNIHLRNIRAVFNDAIDNDLTTLYPFRKFKIKGTKTSKRAITISELRHIFSINNNKYLDFFQLSFFLIGINIIDLCNIKNINGDRIEYTRAKTKRFYSIKVEPEAMMIIRKIKGEKYLIDILDRYKDYRNYTKRLDMELKKIKDGLTSYASRHTWATIAARLDIPKETIAAALGHGGNTITDVYIDFDRKKIDEANRKVIDFVLYNKM